MERFLSSLKQWLKSQRIEQEDLAKKWGENNKNLSAYVTGRVYMPEHLRAKLRKMGFTGDWPKEELMLRELGAKGRTMKPVPPRSRPHGDMEVMSSMELMEDSNPSTYVAPVLPRHVAEAWEIIHEAARAGGADLMAMDVPAVGEMLSAAAEAVAAGRGEEARLRAVRRAEVLFRAMGKSAP